MKGKWKLLFFVITI
jgi:hypothetical protein